MDSKNEINWREYGRIEPGELTLNLKYSVEEDKLWLTFEFTNVSKRSINLFKIETGEKGALYNSIFTVKLNNKTVEYHGEMAKIAPSKDWYITLKPAEKFINKINLLEFYAVPREKGSLVINHRNQKLYQGNEININWP